jgi:predicted acetyltransferase
MAPRAKPASGAAAAVVAAPEATEEQLEVRDALPADRAPAWCLQRTAFSLPPDGPPPHPGFDQELRVLVRGQRVLSCLTLVQARLWVRGAAVLMAGIRHVATDPDEQNRGYASALVRDTLQQAARRGIAGSVLFPFSFRYYRKFGYELGGNHCHFWCRPNCIPAYLEREGCRVAAPADAGRLARFQKASLSRATCAVERDTARWTDLCQDPRYKIVVHENGVLGGYAVLDETRDSYGGRVVRVLDLVAENPAGWRGLLGHLSQLPVESVEWYASAAALASSGLMRSPAPLREGFKPRGIATIRPMFQFRVVDLESALRSAGATFPAGDYRLALRVRDDLLPQNERPLAIERAGDRLQVRAAAASDPSLELDIRLFSQVFCGYLSPSEAASQGLCQASTPEALETAERLFPAGEPFIPELDRF